MADQAGEAVVGRAGNLHPLDQATTGLRKAVLMVDPVSTGYLGSGLELAGPTQYLAGLLRTEEVAHHEVAVTLHLSAFLGRGLAGSSGQARRRDVHPTSSESNARAFTTSSGKSISV